MRVLFVLILASALIGFALHGTAQAAKEGILPFSSFTYESPGLGSSGPVSVMGAQNYDGIQRLEITAFGRKFRLGASQLAPLRGLSVNAVQLSYIHDYAELGGRTLLLVVSRGFTEGLGRRVLIVLNETGNFSIYEKPRGAEWEVQ